MQSSARGMAVGSGGTGSGTNPNYFFGAPVTVKTSTGDSYSGTVFCCDVNDSHTLVFRDVQPNGRMNVRIVKVTAIRDVHAHGPAQNDPADNSMLPTPDAAVMERREQRAIHEFAAQQHTIGIRVTEEAQAIFSFIHRTHPGCTWNANRGIVVLGVTVSPPYGPENCTGGDAAALERVRQVLEQYKLRRMKEKGHQQKVAGSSSGTVGSPYALGVVSGGSARGGGGVRSGSAERESRATDESEVLEPEASPVGGRGAMGDIQASPAEDGDSADAMTGFIPTKGGRGSLNQRSRNSRRRDL